MTIHSHRQQFAINASLYGKRGGSGCSERKKAALTESMKEAQKARRMKQAEKGLLFQVVGSEFMGSMRACREQVSLNSLKGVQIAPVTPDMLRCFWIENNL